MLDRRNEHGQRGQVLPLVAFAIVAFLGVSALVVDVGYWRYEQRMQQGAADSAAMAGANALPFAAGSPSPSPVQVLAKYDAALNGFTDGARGVTVTVNPPPLSGPNTGNNNAVEVVVTKTQPLFFANIFGRASQSVSARAVALRGTATRNCFVALDTGGTGLNFNNSTVNIPQCGMISDSNFLANGSTITATSIGYVGQNQNIWGNTYHINGSSTATPAPATPVTDPCPTLPGCAYLKANPPNPAPAPTAAGGGYNYNVTAGGLILQPGKYPQQVNINPGPGTLTFAPGLYDFQNGLNINSGIPSIVGTGVTFYVENNTLNINSGNMNITAPTTGTNIGMLYYQVGSGDFHINSGNPGNNGAFAGAMYLPNAKLILDGGLSNWTYVIAKDIVFNSDCTVNVPTSVFPGLTTKPATLVE